MRLSQWRLILGLATFLAIVPAARAQPFTPHIGYVYPAGGRQGTTFQVAVGGQYLDGVTAAIVSGDGARATVVELNKPLPPQQANLLLDKLKELQARKAAAAIGTAKRTTQAGSQPAAKPAWTNADEQMLAEIRKKLANFVPLRQIVPAIAETVTLQVTIAPDAEPGQRELRLSASSGLTNPLVFCVGQLPEFSKPPAKSRNEPQSSQDAKFSPAARGGPLQNGAAEKDMSITLPAVVNGQIMPGSVDRFRFKARRGLRLVVAVSARELIPYLSDAVPGWFQAALALYDTQGHELAYADHYLFHPDPVLYYKIPADGEYVIEIRDSIDRGRQDFVYRISLGELPYVTTIFPLGGQAGAATTVELKGWNLPFTTLTHDASGEVPGIYPLSVRKKQWASNAMPFSVDSLPELREQEPNDQPASAQRVTLPVIINGRIDSQGDWDVFRFDGRAGSQVVAEVYARRLNSPLDSVLKLTDAAGRQLAFNDDHEDKGSGLLTHYADSWLSATLPADGTYYLHLGDVQHKGGPEYAYRLRISPPRPDFELRVVPSSINVRPGGTAVITVYALRKDGFSDAIGLALAGAPEGFTLRGGSVPAGQDQVRLTLTAPPTPPKEPVGLSLEGRAMIQGREVSHAAVPAEDMMQAFAYRHLVPAKDLKVAVVGRYMPRAMLRTVGENAVKLPVGGTAQVRLAGPPGPLAGQIQLELSEPPEGITVKGVSPSREGLAIMLQSDATKTKSGLKGNLIVNAFIERPGAQGNNKPNAAKRRLLLTTLPAIPFETVGP